VEQAASQKYPAGCIIGELLRKGDAMKYDKAAKKIEKVMGEFKSGKLHSGAGGKVVKSPKLAIAIALSQAGKSKPMKRGK
jgi:hypothetical protein